MKSIQRINVVSSTILCTSHAALRSSMRTINDRGPSRDPCGIPPVVNLWMRVATSAERSKMGSSRSHCERDDPIIDRSADVATRCVVGVRTCWTAATQSKQSTRYHIFTRSLNVSDLSSCRNISKLEGICSSPRRWKSAPSLSMS